MERHYRVIHYSKVIGWLGVASGTLLLNLKLSTSAISQWLYVSIPLLITSVVFMAAAHYALLALLPQAKPCPKAFILFMIYNFAVAAVCFMVLGSLKLDEEISADWEIIFIPLWYFLFIFGAFCVFITPGLCAQHVRMKREALVLILYFVGALIFSILWVYNIEQDSPGDFWVVLVPLVCVSLTHALSFIPAKSNLDTNEFQFVMCFILTLALLIVRDVADDFPDWVPTLPLMLFLVYWFVSEQMSYRIPDKQSV